MLKYGWPFSVILVFVLISNILFIIGFYYELYNRCSHKDLVKKIEYELLFYYDDCLYYKKIFCENENDSDLYSSKNLKPVLIVLNVMYGLALLIAYITFVASLYYNSKCGLKYYVVFPFFSIIIALFNISVAFYAIEPLPEELSPLLSEELQNEIKEAYISVKDINMLVEGFSIGSLPLTIFCGISYICFYNKVKRNEDEGPLNQLLEEANKNGNHSNKNYPKSDKNNEILGDNLFEQKNN